MLSIIAHMFPPMVGLQLIKDKYEKKIIDIICMYSIICLFSNILSYITINVFTNYQYLEFSVSFFIKFCILNLVSTFIVDLIYVLIKDNTKMHIYKNKNEKQKN